MSLVHIDGFDTYGVALLGTKWTTGAGAATVTMDTGRINGQSLKQVCANNIKYLVRPVPGATTDGGHGVALKMTSRESLLVSSAVDGAGCGGYAGAVAGLMVNADGTVSVGTFNGYYSYAFTPLATGGSVPLNTWVYLEWKWHIAASGGTLVAYVNGAEVGSYTGDTRSWNGGYGYYGTTYSSIGLLCWSSVWPTYGWRTSPYTGTLWLDDTYLANSAIVKGDRTVQARFVTANGATNDGTPSAGDNFECVDEELADTDDFVTLASVNDIELYSVTPVAAGAVIDAVQITALVRRTEDGNAGVASQLRQGGANYSHPTPQGVGADYEFKSFMYEKDALGQDWNDEAFNAMQYGVKKTA